MSWGLLYPLLIKHACRVTSVPWHVCLSFAIRIPLVNRDAARHEMKQSPLFFSLFSAFYFHLHQFELALFYNQSPGGRAEFELRQPRGSVRMLVPCCVLLLCSSSRSLSISQVSLQAFHLTSKIYYAHREQRRRVSKPAALHIARSECVFIYLFIFWKRACHALHELGAHHQPFSSRITVCCLMNNGSNNKNNVKNGILLLARQSCGGVVSFFFPPLELLALCIIIIGYSLTLAIYAFCQWSIMRYVPHVGVKSQRLMTYFYFCLCVKTML